MFYLIEPTDINLALYEKWMSSSPKDKYEAFFADTVREFNFYCRASGHPKFKQVNAEQILSSFHVSL